MLHHTHFEFGVRSGNGHEFGDDLVIGRLQFHAHGPQERADCDHQLDFGHARIIRDRNALV
jgi:hypothetical protein